MDGEGMQVIMRQEIKFKIDNVKKELSNKAVD